MCRESKKRWQLRRCVDGLRWCVWCVAVCVDALLVTALMTFVDVLVIVLSVLTTCNLTSAHLTILSVVRQLQLIHSYVHQILNICSEMSRCSTRAKVDCVKFLTDFESLNLKFRILFRLRVPNQWKNRLTSFSPLRIRIFTYDGLLCLHHPHDASFILRHVRNHCSEFTGLMAKVFCPIRIGKCTTITATPSSRHSPAYRQSSSAKLPMARLFPPTTSVLLRPDATECPSERFVTPMLSKKSQCGGWVITVITSTPRCHFFHIV